MHSLYPIKISTVVMTAPGRAKAQGILQKTLKSLASSGLPQDRVSVAYGGPQSKDIGSGDIGFAIRAIHQAHVPYRLAAMGEEAWELVKDRDRFSRTCATYAHALGQVGLCFVPC